MRLSMKPFLLAGLLLLLNLAVQAQVYYLNFASDVLSVPGRTLAVEQVVDGRDGNPAIGLVYRGLHNKAAAVLFRQGLGPDLTAFVQAQLPARPTDHLVVLCVRQLRVSETLRTMSEQASADLSLDVYVHLPDGYHFVQSAGAHTKEGGLETTWQHSGHIVTLLGQCLFQLDQADWEAATTRPALTLVQLPTDVPAALTGGGRRGPMPPILREVPRRGIYYSFEGFLANRPDTVLPFQIDTIRTRFRSQLAALKWLNVARLRPLVPKSAGSSHRTVPTDIWGFSDGQQLFVRHNKSFFPLARQGNFFTFVGEAPLDVEYMRAASEAQARAQLTGIATVRAIDHSAEPMAYSLDMRTGELAPFPGMRSPARLDTSYVYVYRPSQTAGPEKLKVYLNGREAGSLRPGEYLELPWPYYARPLQLCLGGLANSCQYLVPNTTRHNYLKVTPAVRTRPWQWVSATQGEADLDELDKLHK